ncbi:MAG: hypothetical protein KGH72_00395 [Candidatus Micrarchaeota archaeon]|nr:hypothetical protein [Candidatus Micrarchaeota archaeon]
MKLKVVIVEPSYEINIGYIARVSKNFGVSKLFFVNPKANLKGDQAIMFAKHARNLLESARVYRDFESSVRDCDIVLGTTGVWRKARANFKRIYLLDDAVTMLKRTGKGSTRVAIVIGRDDTGLNMAELERCDMLAYIGTNGRYPVLNISHALAILLYRLTKDDFKAEYGSISDRTVDAKEVEHLLKVFDRLTGSKKIRNRKAVRAVFKRMLYLSQPNRQEIHALITALK